MDKKRLFRILSRMDTQNLKKLSDGFTRTSEIVVIKEPSKTLAMIKTREPVRESLFYIGEVIVSEAVIELDGTRGVAVTMGDDFEKVSAMAVIDAVMNKGGAARLEASLLEYETAQIAEIERENAMHLKTMVSFNTMDNDPYHAKGRS